MKSVINDEFFSRLETLALNMRTNLRGYFGGKHRTNTYGQTVEFSDYREYMLGDDIRRIDWNLYSRFEKYFLKLFTDERQMHVQIFLDCSASMGSTNPEKASYAVGVAAALGFLSVHNMDKLSFRLMKGDIAEDVAGTIVGKNSFFRAMGMLDNIEYVNATRIDKAITSTPVGSSDGLTVIISDFLNDEEEWKKAVDFLNYKRRQVMLVQVLSPEEIEPAYMGRMNLLDVEAADITDKKNMRLKITKTLQEAYAEALQDLIGGIKSFCRSRGAEFFTLRSDIPIEKVFFNELLKAGVMA